MRAFHFTILCIFIFGFSFSQQQYLDSTITEILTAIEQDSIESYMRGLENYGTRYANAENHREVANGIIRKFYQFGYAAVSIDSFLINQWQYNISVEIEGSINPDQIYVLGAHWDSYSTENIQETAPGADDNASGCAAVMEIARVMKAKNYIPESTIQFILFDAEEIGLIGSTFDAAMAGYYQEDIKLMLNNDMIAYRPGDDTRFKIQRYEDTPWAADKAFHLAETYISPEPNIVGGPSNTDSYAYHVYGFHAISFHEQVMNPNYHSPADITDFCNLEYCTEIVKLNAALLTFYTLAPYQVTEFTVKQVGDGTSLLASWNKVYNADIDGYTITVYDDNDNLVNSHFTTDTSYLVQELNEGIQYSIGITVLDADGHEGQVVYRYKTPYEVTFNNGIALVMESYGGVLDPDEEEIDQFYENLLQNYHYEKIIPENDTGLNLGLIKNYSTLIWNINDFGNYSVIRNSLETLEDYLSLGGNLLLTADRLSFSVEAEGVYNNYNYFTEGSFMHDYLMIDSAYLRTLSLFKGAYAQNKDLPYLPVDSSKVRAEDDYHIRLVAEAIFPSREAEAIYFYDTDFESFQGYMKHMPVAVVNNNDIFNTVSLGFPLYYIESYESKLFVDYVLQQIFDENTNYAQFHNGQENFSLWPNPVKDYFIITFPATKDEIITLNVFNALGKNMQQVNIKANPYHTIETKIDVKDLPNGMYYLVIECNNSLYSKKIIK